MSAELSILRVALDMPARQCFDYLCEPSVGGSAAAQPGCRVRVPFGRQTRVGVVLELAATSGVPAGKLRPIVEVLDASPALDPQLLRMLRWAADYYHHPVGEVVAAALPRLARLGARAQNMVEHWHISADGATALANAQPKRAPRQRALLEHLHSRASASADELLEFHDHWRDAAHALAARGWIASSEQPGPAEPQLTAPESAARNAPQLSAEQQVAVAAINARLGSFASFLLHGLTGSGKTEVYLHCVAATLERGQRALVLVPEIGLTPQLVGRFAARFAHNIAVLHSGLTDVQRLAAWRRCLSGEARIVLGTRSAALAPVPELGLIVIDEEHDSSFKQQEGGFRYSARDLALVRAQHAGVPVVLGSATPSLETLHNVSLGRHQRLQLPRRADQAPPPLLTLVDLRQEKLTAGLSSTALQGIEGHLTAGGQILVYINRRGYAPTLLCTACGWIAPCRDCDARLTVHHAANKLRCHHCGAERPLPAQCPTCGYAVKPVGQGTERIEETLAGIFPNAPLARLDRDVVRHHADLTAVVARVESGEARILVGTQMVTKGHDFPDVSLVVVLNADQGLFSTDFRAAERLAQTIVQVAGRAGRAQRRGEVLIQTEYPEHPLLRSLLAKGYDGFAVAALAEREQAAWPPYARLAALRASGTTPTAASEFLSAARRSAPTMRAVKLLGPAPSAMAKRAARWHAQLLVECATRGPLHAFLDAWLPRVAELPDARRVRWVIDVDPLEII